MAWRQNAYIAAIALSCASGTQAAESIAAMAVSAVVADRCEVSAEARKARVDCSHAARVTLSITGQPDKVVPLDPAKPSLFVLPAAGEGGVAILVIAY